MTDKELDQKITESEKYILIRYAHSFINDYIRYRDKLVKKYSKKLSPKKSGHYP